MSKLEKFFLLADEIGADLIHIEDRALDSFEKFDARGDVLMDVMDRDTCIRFLYEIWGETINVNICFSKYDFDPNATSPPNFSIKQMKANKVPPFDK